MSTALRVLGLSEAAGLLKKRDAHTYLRTEAWLTLFLPEGT